MADLTSIFGKISGGIGSSIYVIILIVMVAVFVLLFLGGISFYLWNKKKWNLLIEIKKPRSDGKITLGEWAKGTYDVKRGVIFIKRKGRKIGGDPMKVFDIRRYLQGENLLTVIQIAPAEYVPVLNESWESYIDDETGEKASLLNIRVDSGMNKAWKSAFEASAKKAYSLQSFISQFQTPIAIGIVVICCFVGFAILWTRIG